MLWYGVAFLYVIMTLLSMMIDGHRGLGSTTLVTNISAGDKIIPIQNAFGFGEYGVAFIGDEQIVYSSIQHTNVGGKSYPALIASGGRGGGRSRIQADGTISSSGVSIEVPGQRGYNSTSATAHFAGAAVYNERAEALNEALHFSLAETNSIWGTIQLPFQAIGVFSKFFAKVVTWDYQYLDGPGIWLKLIIFYPLSLMMILALLNVFKDAVSILGLRR